MSVPILPNLVSAKFSPYGVYSRGVEGGKLFGVALIIWSCCLFYSISTIPASLSLAERQGKGDTIDFRLLSPWLAVSSEVCVCVHTCMRAWLLTFHLYSIRTTSSHETPPAPPPKWQSASLILTMHSQCSILVANLSLPHKACGDSTTWVAVEHTV